MTEGVYEEADAQKVLTVDLLPAAAFEFSRYCNNVMRSRGISGPDHSAVLDFLRRDCSEADTFERTNSPPDERPLVYIAALDGYFKLWPGMERLDYYYARYYVHDRNLSSKKNARSLGVLKIEWMSRHVEGRIHE